MKLDSLEDCDCTDGSVSALSEKRPWKKISTPTATTLITFAATLLILLDKLFFFFTNHTQSHTTFTTTLLLLSDKIFFFISFTLNHTKNYGKSYTFFV